MSRIRQSHNPQRLVDSEPEHGAGPRPAPTENNRRAVIGPRRAAGNQGVEVEHRQRLTTELGEPEKVRPRSRSRMAGQTAHDTAHLIRRQRPLGPSRSHEQVPANSCGSSDFLVHGHQNTIPEQSSGSSQF